MTATREKKKKHDSILGLPHINHTQTRGCRYHARATHGQWCRTWTSMLVEEKQKKKKRKAGLQVAILQPLDDDLRSGRGTELDPSTRDQEMVKKHTHTHKKKNVISPAERYNGSSSSCTGQKKKKGAWAKRRKPWRETAELRVMCD